MIHIKRLSDLHWESIQAIAYEGTPVRLGDSLLKRVAAGQQTFQRLIDAGLPCYGVTTGLGQLVEHALDAPSQAALADNMLRARAVAVGPPLPPPVVRAIMVARLVNFLTGLSGVRPMLCEFLVARLNDDFTPWIPSLGHGMGADAIANCHAFQTFIGEGYVYTAEGGRQAAAEALASRGAAPMSLRGREGLALLSGVNVAPACAIHAHRAIHGLLDLANGVAAVSMEALAAPRDSLHVAIDVTHPEPGVAAVAAVLRVYLEGSQVPSTTLQAPVSYRIIPQLHGSVVDALDRLKQCVERALGSFTDNPLMVTDDTTPAGGRFLSVGLFHNQHLVNQVEQVALALAHLGVLSERRLHRLLNPKSSGLAPQLAPRPGLDAGMVAVHKASLDLVARLRMLAQPVSLQVGEASNGQEDYLALSVPAIQRLHEMVTLVEQLLANELLSASVALDQRGAWAGRGVQRLHAMVREVVPPLEQDRSPGPDVEALLALFEHPEWRQALVALHSSSAPLKE